MTSNRSLHLAITAASPPTITDSSPDWARPVPPLTGASIMATPLASSVSASARAANGSMVDMQITMWPGLALWMMPSAPAITDCA